LSYPQTASRALYLRLLRHVFPYWRVFLASILSMVVVAASEPAFPALLKPMLDGSFVSKDKTLILMLPMLLILLFLVRGVAAYISTYSISWVANKLVLDLRQLMFRKLVNLPTQYYDGQSSGMLISKFTFDVTQVTTAATSVVTVLVRDALTVIGLLGWMLYLNWKLTLIALSVTPVTAIIIKLFSVRLRNTSRAVQQAVGNLTHVVEETIECQNVVKIFGGQEYEAARFFNAIDSARRSGMRQMMASAANVPIVQFVAAAALAAIIYVATLQSAGNETTVGAFVSFITAMLMLFAPLKRLTSVSEAMQRGLAAAESVFDLIDQKPEPDAGTRSLPRARGELEFRRVNFRYVHAKHPTLSDVSLRIAPGETVALVGSSGSGKTTLVTLIPRFYHPNSGQILLDGHDIETVKLSDLRGNIALVSQDVVLFNDTVAGNIAYGPMSSKSEAEIIAAAEAAHAMEFIRDMPEGLLTFVGENGVRLSGGQRQRLAIARALLKDAPVLILDEATSALDTASERHVQAALETLMQGRTTIVIAHRISTIEKADRIVVMQKGRIAEIGTHQELLALDGLYANLYRIQFALNGEQPAALS
jgi:subfamily B ATP-binding cassette protein MsbA